MYFEGEYSPRIHLDRFLSIFYVFYYVFVTKNDIFYDVQPPLSWDQAGIYRCPKYVISWFHSCCAISTMDAELMYKCLSVFIINTFAMVCY